MSLLTKLEKVGFHPIDKTLESQFRLGFWKKKTKFFKHLFMPLINLWLHGSVCPGLAQTRYCGKSNINQYLGLELWIQISAATQPVSAAFLLTSQANIHVCSSSKPCIIYTTSSIISDKSTRLSNIQKKILNSFLYMTDLTGTRRLWAYSPCSKDFQCCAYKSGFRTPQAKAVISEWTPAIFKQLWGHTLTFLQEVTAE